MLFDFSKVFKYDYIFEYIPSWNPRISVINFYIFGGIIFLGIIFVILERTLFKKRYFWQKLSLKLTPLCYTIGTIGVILIFFRYQAIPFLSSRFLVYILILVTIIWIALITKYFIRNYPSEIKDYNIKNRIKRYLPKKNKK